MNQTNLRYCINLILSTWNPIGVPGEIALSEYTFYVPRVINSCNNKERLYKVLQDMLIEMGLKDHGSEEELQNLCALICKVCEEIRNR